MVAAELIRRGWPCVIVFPDEGIAVERARAASVPVHVVRAPRVLRHYGRHLRPYELVALSAALPGYWVRLGRFLRRHCDLAHVNDHRGLVLAVPAALLARRRVVWHVHTVNASARLNRLGGRLAVCVLVPSWSARDESPGLVGRVHMLPNAIPERLLDLPEPEPDLPPLLVTASRLHPIKGIDVLIEAVAILRDRDVAVRLLLVGGVQAGHEEHADELKALVRQRRLTEVVTFAGEQEQPQRLWHDAFAYVQPSRYEPGGLAALEAMACALPVVASRVGGLPDVVTEGRTGRLVQPDAPKALADVIAELVADPSAARAMGRAGRERAHDFTVKSLVDRLIHIYESFA